MIISLGQVSAIARASITRLQAELGAAQQELASGRSSDLGRTLGARSTIASSIRASMSEIGALKVGNQLASGRLSASATALESLTSIAQTLQQRLLGAGPGGADAEMIRDAGLAALSQTIAIANTTFDGVYLFSGLNDGGKPLNEFVPGSGTGPSEELARAFRVAFGNVPGDQANKSISASDMQSFLETTFAQLFASDQWKSAWSGASDKGADFRISEDASLQYPAVGNSVALRNLVKALTMVAGLGLEALNSDARQLVVDRAASDLGSAISGMSGITGQIGLKQNMVEAASQDLSLRYARLATRLDELESVDPAEIAVRISALSEQLQASYEVTAKLAHLSLVNYI